MHNFPVIFPVDFKYPQTHGEKDTLVDALKISKQRGKKYSTATHYYYEVCYRKLLILVFQRMVYFSSQKRNNANEKLRWGVRNSKNLDTHVAMRR